MVLLCVTMFRYADQRVRLDTRFALLGDRRFGVVDWTLSSAKRVSKRLRKRYIEMYINPYVNNTTKSNRTVLTLHDGTLLSLLLSLHSG